MAVPEQIVKEPNVLVTHYYEKQRVVTVAYQHYQNRARNNVKFAASIFRRTGDGKEFDKEEHVKTAKERLRLRPLWMTFNMHAALRRQVHLQGVKNKVRMEPEKTNSPENVVPKKSKSTRKRERKIRRKKEVQGQVDNGPTETVVENIVDNVQTFKKSPKKQLIDNPMNRIVNGINSIAAKV